MVTLADMEGNEAFDAANLGTADVVEVRSDCGKGPSCRTVGIQEQLAIPAETKKDQCHQGI